MTHHSTLRGFARIASMVLATGIYGARAQVEPPAASAPTDAALSTPTPLSSEWLYNGVNRPVMIRITPPDTRGQDMPVFHLVLLAHDGTVLIDAASVRPGRVDLAEIMPGIWLLRKAGYLQALMNGEPYGSALVIQPMLSRMVPLTEEATRPASNATYTKIVGWRSTAQRGPVRRNDDSAEDGSAEDAAASDAASAQPEQRRVLTGVRIYPDNDVLMQTTLGTMRFALRADAAPNTAWNFRQLCAGGYYRDVMFHRIVPRDSQGLPFVIQGGDPTGTGEGSAGYWVPIEPSDLPHDFGVLSMARSGDPDSAGSQFFVCLSREGTARLDMQYCAFGELVDGADVVRAIASVELADVRRGRPADPPVILSTTFVPASPRQPGMGRLDMQTPVEPVLSEPHKPGRVDR